MDTPPRCPYCKAPSVLTKGSAIFPFRTDLAELPYFRCAPCDAHVGCHPGTTSPLGSLAGPALRKARAAAHAAFDPTWRGIGTPGARRRAYTALARELGLTVHACHIAWLDESECARVVEICSRGLKISA